MTVNDLKGGEFAITQDGVAIVGVSDRSFTPKEDHAYVIHLANGIGAFPKNTKCQIVEPVVAFTEAAKFLGIELFRKGEYKGIKE